MKKPFTTLIVFLFAASFGCYCQEKKPAAKTRPVTDSPKQIEVKDDWGDINISPPSEPGPDVIQDDNNIYDFAGVQVVPVYPGGIDAFMVYCDRNTRKDSDYIPDGTYKVFASFVVEKDGSISDIKILRDPGYGLGKEVERVLKSMKKKWSPGIVNGKPVRVRYTLPIIVKLP